MSIPAHATDSYEVGGCEIMHARSHFCWIIRTDAFDVSQGSAIEVAHPLF